MSSEPGTTTRPFSELLTTAETRDPERFAVDERTPASVVRPASVAELSELVRSAHADDLSMIPWGGGTQMGLGNLPDRFDAGIDMTELNEVLRYDPDDMTMSVQTGCRLQDLNQMLGENRQVLPVDAVDPGQATIGGVTATGTSGPRRLGYGPLRDLIIGMSVMATDGTVTKAGGQVVKNVTGFDMMRMHHGAMGSLGLIISINFKVIPKPQSERTVIATFDSLDQADTAAKEIVQSQLGVTAVVVLNAAASAEISETDDGRWAISVRCEAPPSAVVRQAERVVEYIGDQAQDVVIEDSTERSEARWVAICAAMDQRPTSPDIAIRLGQAASKLGACAKSLSDALTSVENARLTLDYGSGLCYLRIPRGAAITGFDSGFLDSLSRHGDHCTVMTAPVEIKQHVDVFGGARAGFSMIEALKANFDPDRVLNPGRYIGRL
ncbi:MAG: FAD-binding oxidoreductase [Thermomicrobiaceae bacterium]